MDLTTKEINNDFLENKKAMTRVQHQSYFGHEVRIQVVRESNPEQDYCINKSEDAYNLVKDQMEALDREAFLVASLNTKNKLLGLNLVSLGTLNQSLVHPREVFKSAILMNALSIVLFHNHPGGDPKPSTQDSEVTKRLTEAGTLLGIKIVDHIIVGYNTFYSFLDEGLLM